MADRRQPSVDRQPSAVDSRQPAGGTPQPTDVRRVVIDEVRPAIDGGRFPIKRTPGECVDVTAVLFADGHDVVVAVLRDRYLGAAQVHRVHKVHRVHLMSGAKRR